jgi:RimJ/RimL family protein N-acetyltransferase
VLTGESLRLAPLRPSDVDALFAWINDRDQVLFNSRYRPVHAWQHREWFDSIRDRNDVAIFGIRLIDPDTLIGSCQLTTIDPYHGTAELQIRIGKLGERGLGYGTEAVRLLLLHAFRDLRLRRVELSVFASNQAARRCYAKVGFREEGVLRKAAFLDGQVVDVVLMGILSGELAG